MSSVGMSSVRAVVVAGVLVSAAAGPVAAWRSGGDASNPMAPWLRTSSLQHTADSPLLPSLRLDRGATASVGAGQTSSASNRYILPVLLSLAIPGTGEMSMGHWWNGLPLLAADVATWIGYAKFETDGQEQRDAFEAFADAHWDSTTWGSRMSRYYDPESPEFITGSPELWVGEPAPGYCDCSPPYIPYSEDPQEYYENAGKYRHFYPGWDDWMPPSPNPAGFTDIPDSPNRRTYTNMRIESNESFDNANTMLAVAAVTRVVSVLQSIWLVRRDGRNDGLRFEPVTFGGSMGSGLRVLHRF